MKTPRSQTGQIQGCMLLHADLVVRSMDAALEFYCTKLQFVVVEDAIVRGPIVRHFSSGCYDAWRLALLRVSPVGAMIELLEFQPESALKVSAHPVDLPTGWVSILVPDLNAHIDRMLEKGLHPASDVFSVELPKSGACKVVFYRDPDGNGLEFMQMLRQSPTTRFNSTTP